MTRRHSDTAEPRAAVETRRDRFRNLPERIRTENTFISVPVTVPSLGRDGYHPDEWLARNVWCGSLL